MAPTRPPKRFTTKVVGVTFCSGYPQNLYDLDAAYRVRIGEGYEGLPVILQRNPANAYDANAIEVHVPSVGMIGHVSGSNAAWLAPMLDAGAVYLVEVSVVLIHPEHEDRPGIEIVCRLVDPEAITSTSR